MRILFHRLKIYNMVQVISSIVDSFGSISILGPIQFIQMQEQQSKQESVPLVYDEKMEPEHRLKVQNHNEKYEVTQVLSKKLGGDGLVVRYDNDNELAAIGCRNGDRIIYDVVERKIVQKYNCSNQNPVTTLKWRPMANSTFKTLVTADSEGSLEYWHIPTLKKLFQTREEDNTINTIDFNRTGSAFATAGKDCNIRIYDEETKSLSILLKKADWNSVGHDNRIFAVKFIDETTLISGGWDSVIHIWDLRQAKSVRSCYGANISGESLDFQDGKILAGCYSVKDQLQIWDFNKGVRIECIDWTKNPDISAYIFAAAYSRYDIGMVGAGSTGAQSSVRIYKDLSNKNEHVMLSQIKGVNEGCFSFDFSPKKSQFMFTTAYRGLYVFDIKRT